MLLQATSAKLVVAAVLAGGVTLGGGVAAAATGSLPDAAQQIAKDTLDNVGMTVPGPEESAGDDAAERGNADHPSGKPADTANSGKGEEISELARTTSEEGADKGELISSTASDGASQAGQRSEHAQPSRPAAPTAAAEPADGAANGETASDGASTAGSANADTHR
jgi:hypothetical protein